jgi:GNAT superfamily N-acetyltransferase
MKPQIVTRLATIADLAGVERLARQAVSHSAHRGQLNTPVTALLEAVSAQVLRREIANGSAWVATVNGYIIGFASLDGTTLNHIYVDPTRHGQGAARELLAALEHSAIDRGVSRIRATAPIASFPAFEHLGYLGDHRTVRRVGSATVPSIAMHKVLTPTN